MNFVAEVLMWQIPFSFVVSLFITGNMVGLLTPLVLLFYYCFVWLVVAVIIFTSDLLVTLLAFTVCRIVRRLVS